MTKRSRGMENPMNNLRRILPIAAVLLLAMFFIAPVAAENCPCHSEATAISQPVTFQVLTIDNPDPIADVSYYLLPPGTYYLEDNITLDYPLMAMSMDSSGNAVVNLCLNGHVITWSSAAAEKVLMIYGLTVNMYDCNQDTTYYFTPDEQGLWILNPNNSPSQYSVTGGIITGGDMCGVALMGGILNMFGGNIVGNTHPDEPYPSGRFGYGGGVGLAQGSAFTMSGGSIVGNYADHQGGGVAVGGDSNFHISGGYIGENTAKEMGGGVATSIKTDDTSTPAQHGTLTVSGTAKISGNHAPTAPNVYIRANEKITIGEAGLSGDALIRITTDGTPTYSDPIAFTDTLSSSGYSKFFVSDGDQKVYTIAEENSALVHTVKSYEVKTGQIQHGTLELTDRIVKYGSPVTVVIDCDDGYEVETITVEKESDGEEVPVEGNKFNMPSDNVIISVTLKKIEYTITIDDSSKDNITGVPAKAGVNDTITITVTIGENEILRNITVTPEDGSGIAPFDTGTTFSMPAANVTLKANIVQKEAQITYYSVTVDSGLVNGTISTNVSSAKEDETIKVMVTPEEGYTYSDLNYTVTDGDPAPITDNTFTMPNGDVVVSAKFTKTMHDVEKGTVSNGQISVDKTTAGYGDTVKVTATPNPGYKFSHFIVAKKGDPNNNFTTRDGEFSMPNYAVTVTAEFTQELYTITVNADKATVTLTPEGDTATYKQEITVSATANEGYVVKEIRVLKEDGSLHKTLPSSSGTFEMPASAVTIKVECEAEPSPSPEPEPSSDSSAPHGSSIWLTETQTPEVPPTETPTETLTPTQPSTPDTEPTIPVAALIAGGLAVIVVIGVGAGLVLRRK